MIFPIENVKVGLLVDSKEQEIPHSGFMGTLLSHQNVVMFALIGSPAIFGVSVDGKGNMVPKRDHNKHQDLPRIYKATIPIKIDRQGMPHTEYPGNHFRLLYFTPDGEMWTWEIALISQAGDFFLSLQRTYRIRCYRQEEGTICWPSFEEGSSVKAVVESLWSEEFLSPHFVDNLPLLESYTPEPIPSSEGIPKDAAQVLWYNQSQQFGCLLLPDGRQARVHWTSILGERRPAYLRARELVRYKDLVKPRETKNRPTTFRLEAVKVTPLSLE